MYFIRLLKMIKREEQKKRNFIRISIEIRIKINKKSFVQFVRDEKLFFITTSISFYSWNNLMIKKSIEQFVAKLCIYTLTHFQLNFCVTKQKSYFWLYLYLNKNFCNNNNNKKTETFLVSFSSKTTV